MRHLEDFFTHGNHGTSSCAGPNAPHDTACNRQDDTDGIHENGVLYLHGPPHAGQTSLLLQFGFTQVKAGKSVVLVMWGHTRSLPDATDVEIVPLTACSACHEPVQNGERNDLWRRITVKYS